MEKENCQSILQPINKYTKSKQNSTILKFLHFQEGSFYFDLVKNKRLGAYELQIEVGR